MRLPLHLVVVLLGVDVAAMAVLARTASGAVPAWTLVGALGLALGATAALSERTWGIGLVLAAASSLVAAAALGLAPSSLYLVGALGALPFVLTLRPMARFHVGATALFALLAATLGAAPSVAIALLR